MIQIPSSKEMSFLSAPYSHPDPAVVAARMEELEKADFRLTLYYSKITITPLSKHYMLKHGKIPSDWNYWEQYSKILMNACKEIIVIRLPGWESSVGVAGEMDHAIQINIPIVFYDPETHGDPLNLDLVRTACYEKF